MKKVCMLCAAAALLLVACGPKETTQISGKFAADSMAAEAQIMVGELVDTTVAVVDGKFKLEVPTELKALSYAMADGQQVLFVADGTPITIDFESGKAVSKGGVNARMQEYLQWNEDFMKDFREKMAAASEEEKDSLVNVTVDTYNEYLVKVVKENSNNVLGVVAITSLQLEDDAQMVELLNGLDEDLKADPRISQMIQTYDAAAKTAEGEMFTDFEVDGVKFSDFIGQGKYMLVDFWASWCGPCRGEIPNLHAVYDEFKGDQFDVLSVAVWDKLEDTQEAAKEENIVWNQIMNAQRIPTDIYGIPAIPQIMLFGPDGTILKRNLRGDDIRKAVAEALGAE